MRSADKSNPGRARPGRSNSRPLLTPLLIIGVLLLIVTTSGANGNPKGKKQVKMTGLDAIALPGQPAVIRAKLERHGLLGANKDLKGFVLEFYRGEALVGTRTTDDEGFAHLEIPAPERGRTEIVARFPGTGAYESNEARAYAYSFDPQKPGMLVDIDHTIADISWLEFLAADNSKIPTLPEAPEVLTRLSTRFNIIFLTAREDAFADKTRAWLELRKFPPAPVIYKDIGQSPLLASRYKDKAIKSLQKRLQGLQIGVGDKREDAHVYVKHGLRAFIIGPHDIQDKLPAGATWVTSWEEIEKLADKEPPNR
jgi:hypothetical protein